jgi:5-methylcytosine-specific restriction endonuclease McrA
LVSDYNYNGTGKAYYRKWCSLHYKERRAENAGLTVLDYNRRTMKKTAENAGLTVSDYNRRSMKNAAKNAGFESVTDYHNSKHPYRKYRKAYCENIDGRLGYICTYPKKPIKAVSAMLQVDHIDGNPANNKQENLQTFCPNCHTYKTYIYEDYRSPGRKARGITRT